MLKEEIKNIKEGKTELRKFGITVGIVFSLIGTALYLLEKNSFYYFGGIGFLLILSGLLYPIVLRPINKIWMSIAIILGWCMSRVILFILYYVVITPLGLTLKLIGKDFLKLKFERNSSTYWEKRDKKESIQTDYEKQF